MGVPQWSQCMALNGDALFHLCSLSGIPPHIYTPTKGFSALAHDLQSVAVRTTSFLPVCDPNTINLHRYMEPVLGQPDGNLHLGRLCMTTNIGERFLHDP